MKSFKIRQSIVLLLIAGVSHLFAQKITVSEPLYYNMENLEGYSVSPKINSNYLFFSWQNEKLKVEALNENLKKIWSKDEIIERNAKVIVLELIPNLESFCVVVFIQKDSIDYIKVLKFDNQVKLLDSAILSVWQSKHFNHRIEKFISEDKKVLLSVTSSDISAHNILCAFSLDSMKSIWKYNIREKPVSKEELFRHWVLTNDGTAFFITDEKSGAGGKNKQIDVIQYDKNNSIIDFKITGSKLNSKQANFSFDNVKKQIIGFGTYSNQNHKVSNGIYYLSIPQFAPLNYKFSLVPFDNNFVTAFFGKKVKRNIGIKNLKVRNINHQTNGSTIVFFEQSHFERYQYWRGSWLHSTEIDFFYNNMFSMSFDTSGNKESTHVYVKKQNSEGDEGRFSSFTLMKTPKELKVLFNTNAATKSWVEEYKIQNNGVVQHSIGLNIKGKGLNLAFRNAIQTAPNELFVSSEGIKQFKLVKINW